MSVYDDLKPLEGKELDEAISFAIKQNESFLRDYTYKYKYSHSVNGFYPRTENVEWTTGFWTGELWLSYELSGNTRFKDSALIQVDSFLNRIINRIDVNHHDMGFLYSPSCVAAYKLTGSETGKRAALLAADNLKSRFQEKGGFIQAWGDYGAADNYRLIIDCLLNIPILYWATEETGDESYKRVADSHLETAMKCVVRPDNSTYHTYFFDIETGKPLKGVTFQGYRDGSAWARGQAWGIYGSALAYKYLRKSEYLDIFRRVTGFFLDHLPEDIIPYWDFDFKYPSTEPKDTSALAVAICGMLEAAKYTQKEESDRLISTSKKLMGELYRNYACKDPLLSNGQLLHGTYARKSPYNPCNNRGVNECNIWGDYFYMEALARLVKSWEPYW